MHLRESLEMAYTHCLVLYLDHDPNAKRPAIVFKIVGIDVQSHTDARKTLMALNQATEHFDESVKEARKCRHNPKQRRLFSVSLCKVKLWQFRTSCAMDKGTFTSGQPTYRPHWKAELLSDVAGDAEGYLKPWKKSQDLFGSHLKVPDPIVHGDFDKWLEVSSLWHCERR